MEVTVSSIVTSEALVTLLTCAWRVVNWVWLRPKQLEKWLRVHGFKGNPYKVLYGDTKEMISMTRESRSKPMDTSSDDIIPRVLPSHHHSVHLHGKDYFEWMGPIPRINIANPKLIKEILFNYEFFQKPLRNPLGRFLPTKTNMRMKAIYREVGDLLSNIINKREWTIKENDGDNDLLGILLKTNLKEIQEKGNKKNITLATKEVIEECKLFYLAGQETTSALLVWTMILLSKYQKWQALAREEVLVVFGDKKPDSDGLNQLKTMTMILYEVLRDVTEFKPERFSEGVTKATKGPGTFIPFGGGPREVVQPNWPTTGTHHQALNGTIAPSTVLVWASAQI
ncbi:hypothetical protein TEA_015881 [Camellia sinensis var. sinensis]|uniref:Cytochrome P450 n=1 Tax=Camellia sinensis var. sinensis TaxID=542762 RepID=A0A4S4DEP6_CAMSN|nr:hypothetical protein TEA_015881 [Camellia sinensis var. sinensis]